MSKISARAFREVELFDKNGQKVNYKKLVDGEFLAESGFESWNYQINLSLPVNPSAMAHVSWLSDGEGILMLGDLLPEFAEKTSAKITIAERLDNNQPSKSVRTKIFLMFPMLKRRYFM